MKFVDFIDLLGNEMRNAVIQVLSTAPSSPKVGQVYYNSSIKRVQYYTPDGWQNAEQNIVLSVHGRTGVVTASAGDYTANQITNVPAGGISSTTVQAALNELDGDKANVSHTHTSSQITDFHAAVRTNRLDQMATPTAAVSMGNQIIANVGTPSVGTDAANKSYVDSIISTADAMVWKGGIDCSTNPNYPAGNKGETWKVTVAGKIGGASGTAVSVGDTMICGVDGSAAGTEASVGANWTIVQANVDKATTTTLGIVQFATQAETESQSVSDKAVTPSALANYVLNSELSSQLGTVARKYSSDIGNGTLTTIPVTHGLGTLDVTVAVKEVATGELVHATVTVTDTNNVSVKFGTAPTNNQYRVVVIG